MNDPADIVRQLTAMTPEVGDEYGTCRFCGRHVWGPNEPGPGPHHDDDCLWVRAKEWTQAQAHPFPSHPGGPTAPGGPSTTG